MKSNSNIPTCKWCGGSNIYGHQNGCPDNNEPKEKPKILANFCPHCSYLGDKKYKLCGECFAENQKAIKEFLSMLDSFKEKYGEETTCEIMSEIVGQRIEADDMKRPIIFNPEASIS